MIRSNLPHKYIVFIAVVFTLLAVSIPSGSMAQGQPGSMTQDQPGSMTQDQPGSLAQDQSGSMTQDQSGSQTVKVIGTGHIINENISNARKNAISDSLVTAVGMVATNLLHQMVVVESFKDINRLLLSDAGNFVQYKILAENTTGQTYRVMVEATVAVDKIRDLFTQNGILVENRTPLKVLLLIAEKQLGNSSYQSWWHDPYTDSVSEAALATALSSQGITVLDHGQFLPAELEASLAAGGELPGAQLSNEQAVAFGQAYQADVVVVGLASTEQAPNSMGNELKSFKGMLSIRAVRVDNGDLLAESTRTCLTADADDSIGSHSALTEAGTRTGALLAGQIQSAWQKAEVTGPASITVVVKGGYQLAHFVAFRRTLSEIPGANNLQTQSITPDGTTLQLEYEGTAKELAETLLLKSFSGFGVNITEASADTLRLSLQPDLPRGSLNN